MKFVTVIECISIDLQTKQAICMGSRDSTGFVITVHVEQSLRNEQVLQLLNQTARRLVYLFTVAGHWVCPERDEVSPCPEIVLVELIVMFYPSQVFTGFVCMFFIQDSVC